MLLLSRIEDGVRALIGVCEMMYGVCRVDGVPSLPLDQPAGRFELKRKESWHDCAVTGIPP